MSSPMVRAWYAIAVSFFACLVVAIASVGYTSYVQRKSDQRWCSLLTGIGNGQRQTPPPSESGKRFAVEIEKLRREFGCR